VTTLNKERAWIVDVDGTLAHNVSGRNPFHDHLYDKIVSDALDHPVSLLVNLLYKDGATIIICSGRTDTAKTATEDWLLTHEIPYQYLFMRATGDSRRDSIVKEEIYRNHIEPNFDVEGVLDDRKQVVDMWRSIGLKCLQVEPGDF